LLHGFLNHVAGCRQFFNATRNTLTYVILETYLIGSKPQFTEQAAPLTTTATRELGEKV
ncbi:MAG: sarcosine oxidase subunit delta, partial [Pseudomonadales bacterium]|nr:sarcosine oxidase subunit delta [Pseudomonadales bacterium]